VEFWSAYKEANRILYEDIDWALDVSAAQLRQCMIRDVPPDKIRIDPEVQAVITPESVAGGESLFEAEELVGVVGFHIDSVLKGDGVEALVRVEPSTKYPEPELRLIRKLHDSGLALPILD
jgi:hypothetical protein